MIGEVQWQRQEVVNKVRVAVAEQAVALAKVA